MARIAIIGASSKRSKFGNKSVRAHVNQGWTVYPVHPKEASIEGLRAYPSILDLPEKVDRVALYLPPELGLRILEDIAAAGSAELYINPGAGSSELRERAAKLGIPTRDVCAIVAIGESPSSYD
jgi:uncharacterized protein